MCERATMQVRLTPPQSEPEALGRDLLQMISDVETAFYSMRSGRPMPRERVIKMHDDVLALCKRLGIR